MEKILEIRNLKKHFILNKGILGGGKQSVRAVDGISFTIHEGEILGLVGESGCGKSTTARTIAGIYKPSEGEIFFMGENLAKLGKRERKKVGRNMQMIFQDPYASLNPRMTVKEIILEPLRAHQLFSTREREELVMDLLRKVGLNPDHASRYPHEFSGGQRQRIGIARALALKPKFLICDEPISALDVSIQAQIVNMLIDLKEELGLTYLFIAHDLSMVKYISNRIGIMYLGNLVEIGEAEKVFEKSLHPYTQALLSAIPIADPELSDKKKMIALEGDIPSPIHKPSGCSFRTRCKYAMDICSRETPELKEVENDYFVACHLIKN